MNPVGEFPLNDDWSYSRAVQSLLDTGSLHLTGFTSMPLFVQVLWGALFCLPFGFSFTALRLSTLVLGLVGVFATYGIFQELGRNNHMSLLAALVIALNPLYFSLSFTFMTDVPFFAFSILAFLFLVRYVRKDRNTDLLAGCLCACAATLIRHIGVIIPLSFSIAYIVKNGLSKPTFLRILLLTIPTVVALYLYEFWIRSSTGLPYLYNISKDRIIAVFSSDAIQTVTTISESLLIELLYLGLFALPFLILVAISDWRSINKTAKVVYISGLLAITVVLTDILTQQNLIMPLSGNVFFDIGLGPVTLRDVYLLGLPHFPHAPKSLWIVVTVASIFGAILLVQYLSYALAGILIKLVKYRSTVDMWIPILLTSACAFYSILIGITGYFDRYYVFLLPLVMLLVMSTKYDYVCPNMLAVLSARSGGEEEGSWREPSPSIHPPYATFLGRYLPILVAVVILVIYGYFSLAATHDYLSWNRSRWEALNYLTEQALVSYKDIDGGFEFNGWYNYSSTYREQPSKSWWWVENDDYALSFGPVSGYREIKRYIYKTWLPFEEGGVFVLHKLSE